MAKRKFTAEEKFKILEEARQPGAQRSDPKSGDPDDYPHGHGPQGDVVRIYNMVRCVRSGLVSGIEDDETSLKIPNEYYVSQNYPNPFNASTMINYELPQQSQVIINIYNILGRRVSIIQDGIKQPGYYQVAWQPSDLSSGIYFYKLQAGDYTEIKKMILLK